MLDPMHPCWHVHDREGFAPSFAGSLTYSSAYEISCPDANPNLV